MKNIQPFDIWKDGSVTTASRLSLKITYDDLNTEAVFEYHLSDENNNSLVNGTFLISGDDYQNWGQSLDSNSDAYNLASTKLNLTITGDYVAQQPSAQ